jgi:hypothetical protein
MESYRHRVWERVGVGAGARVGVGVRVRVRVMARASCIWAVRMKIASCCLMLYVFTYLLYIIWILYYM